MKMKPVTSELIRQNREVKDREREAKRLAKFLEGRNAELTQALDEARATAQHADDLQTEVGEWRSEYLTLEKEKEMLEAAANQPPDPAPMIQLQKENIALREGNEALRTRFNKADASMATLKAAITKAEGEATRASAQLVPLQDENVNLKTEVNELKAKLTQGGAAPGAAAPGATGAPPEVQQLENQLARIKKLHEQQADVIAGIKEPMNKVIDGFIDAFEKLDAAYEIPLTDPDRNARIKQVTSEMGRFIAEEVALALEEIDKLLETKPL